MQRFRIVESQTGNVRFKFTTSLGPGSALGKIGKLVRVKKKNIGERREPRGSLGPPLAGPASLADVFPIWPRFLPCSPTAEPGPRLVYNCTPQTRKWADIHVRNAELLLLLIIVTFYPFCWVFFTFALEYKHILPFSSRQSPLSSFLPLQLC